jgi:hypothetical protein
MRSKDGLQILLIRPTRNERKEISVKGTKAFPLGGEVASEQRKIPSFAFLRIECSLRRGLAKKFTPKQIIDLTERSHSKFLGQGHSMAIWPTVRDGKAPSRQKFSLADYPLQSSVPP